LPISTAPASRRRDQTGASCCDTKSFHSGTPQLVASPETLIDSFSVIGRPSSRPSAFGASAARAASRARSKSRTTTALSFVSYDSMRRM
jgi:hypothetical protein